MAKTLNGAVQYSAANPIVELFFMIGAAAEDKAALADVFNAALNTDKDLTLRTLLWSYDCRGGAGRRDNFLQLFTAGVNAEDIAPDEARYIMQRVPELGRWDMLCSIAEQLTNKSLSGYAICLITSALLAGDKLCAKWAPRKGHVAARIRGCISRRLNRTISYKKYRKLLVANTDVVETAMSANKWDKIDFSHVPSVASTRYRGAFARHCEERYNSFLHDVAAGKATMNMKVAYPHDIVRMLMSSSSAEEAADIMWKQLPELQGTMRNVLCMADVSGSMLTHIAGSVTAMDVALSLAVYFSQRIKGRLQDKLMAFSGVPHIFDIAGKSLSEAISTIRTECPNPYNTDFHAAYTELLKYADMFGCTQKDMPETLLVLSDMQFDSVDAISNYEALKRAFARRGLIMPKLIFWNLVGYGNGIPAPDNARHVTIMSGYSPMMLDSILSGTSIMEGIRNAVCTPRYNWHN